MLLEIVQAARRRQPNPLLAFFRHLGAFGLFFIAILDSSPVPTFAGPDILTVILAATHRNPWYEYAAVATAGSVIGAFITFRLARRAGHAYLDSKFGRRVSGFLKLFENSQTGVLAASAAIPFPFPTSLFFAAAGASGYDTRKYLIVVAVARGIRYSVLAIIADVYGRRIIRVLRHPTQYWGWLLLFGISFAAIIAAGMFVNRRMETSSATAAWKPNRLAS